MDVKAKIVYKGFDITIVFGITDLERILWISRVLYSFSLGKEFYYSPVWVQMPFLQHSFWAVNHRLPRLAHNILYPHKRCCLDVSAMLRRNQWRALIVLEEPASAITSSSPSCSGCLLAYTILEIPGGLRLWPGVTVPVTLALQATHWRLQALISMCSPVPSLLACSLRILPRIRFMYPWASKTEVLLK